MELTQNNLSENSQNGAQQANEDFDNPFLKEIIRMAEQTRARDDARGKGAENFVPREQDFQKDGLWHCGICGEALQREVPIAGLIYVDCLCERKKKADAEATEKKKAADARRKEAFGSEKTKRFTFTFANDDGRSPLVAKQMKAYCDDFDTYRKNGNGLLLYSERNGGGKTFFSCAVANELIDRGYRVRVTDFMALRDEMLDCKAFNHQNKIDFLQKLRCYDLIVIDDLGTENSTEYMMEVEYRIINDLTENCTPIILTTNYTLRELNETTDREKKRIFDRVFGSCVPVNVEPPDGKSRRLEKCKQITADFRRIAQSADNKTGSAK